MDIDAAQSRGLQHTLRQQHAVGGDDGEVDMLVFEVGGLMVEISRLSNGEFTLHRFGLDGAGPQFPSTSGWAVRLAVDRDDLRP